MWLRTRIRSAACISVVIGGLVFAPSPAGAQPLAPDKVFASFPDDARATLYRPSFHRAPDGSVRVVGFASTATLSGTSRDLRVRVNFARDGLLLLGWRTLGTADSGTHRTSGVLVQIEFSCRAGATYKLYSDHWVDGRQFSPRLEGQEWPCPQAPPLPDPGVPPIWVG